MDFYVGEGAVSSLDLELIVRPSDDLGRETLDNPRGKSVSTVMSVLARFLDAVSNGLLVVSWLFGVAEASAHHSSA